MTTPNNLLSINAADFESKAKLLSDLLAKAKRAMVAVNSIEKIRTENTTKAAELKIQLQAALDAGDLDAMSKHTTALKVANGKLAENPVEKLQAFDEAIDALVEELTVD